MKFVIDILLANLLLTLGIIGWVFIFAGISNVIAFSKSTPSSDEEEDDIDMPTHEQVGMYRNTPG